MPSIIERNGRFRALIRKAGHTRCATFSTSAAAKRWAAQVERGLEELKASGVMQPRGQTLADLIDRYVRELYPVKPWGRSKSADLRVLKRDLGHHQVSHLTSFLLTEHFRKGKVSRVGTSGRMAYLVGVLRVARTVWHLDVPLQAALDARTALSKIGVTGRSRQRDRRVSDTELALLMAHLDKRPVSEVPMAEIVRFCVATAMRISEVCKLRWADLDPKGKTIKVRERKHPDAASKAVNAQVVPLLAATGYDALEIIQRQPRNHERIFPYNSHTVGTYFTRAVSELNEERPVLPDLHLHDLRHEAVSRLFAAGYQIQEVALVSGHRNWQMLRRYTHVKASDLHRTKHDSERLKA
jgi:integrase